MAQLIDFVINLAVLFNVGVRSRDIRLRLVIIVVGDKVFHCVFRKKLAKLGTQLRCKRFVVRQYQRRPVGLCDHICHGKRLAGARDAKQRLLLITAGNARNQFFNCLRLVAGGPVIADQLKMVQRGTPFQSVSSIGA